MTDLPPTLCRSSHVSAFAHMGDVYLYHDLYGYLMKMSPDVLGVLAAFAEPAPAAEVTSRLAPAFPGQDLNEFIDIFAELACLVAPGTDELDGIWDMVPVKSRWNVWRRDGDTVTLYTAWGERPFGRHTLTSDELALWDAIDGETRLAALADQHGGKELARRLIPRLVHHQVQALKLSHMPMSMFKGRRDLRPAYLTSTMPYAPYDPATQPAPAPRTKSLSTAHYYQTQVHDPDAQFDHQETTLSHLLREPHPALRGRTYGQALVDALLERQLLPASGTARVLEIGAGLGYVARDACARMRERGLEVTYDILELSAPLAAAQRRRCAGLPVTVREGDALSADLGTGYDLILCNEMIGDLPAVELTRAELGLDTSQSEDERKAKLAAVGAAGRVIEELDLKLGDAPDSFYLTVGAFELVRRVYPALAPGGTCVMTEFGELNTYPRLSTQLDHPELSIHFGHLRHVAEKLGFATTFEFIIDLLDFERTLTGMATTRSYFRALGHMLAEAGITVEKRGYTEEMFDALLAGKLDRSHIGELYFDRIEDRLMGLVPHEFKALILAKPAS